MLDEDADLVLGAGVADELAAGVAEGGVGFLHEFLKAGEVGERRLGVDLEVEQFLRELVHDGGELGEGGLALDHHAQDLERAEDAVAGGDVVAENEVAGIFTAEGVIVLAHALDDAAVADGGGLDLDAVVLHGFDQAEIAHDGGDERVVAEFSLLFQADGAEAEDAVAADDLAVGVGEDDAVGVAVEGDAEVGLVLADELAGGFRVERAAAVIDVEAVRVVADGDDFRAEFLKNERADEVGGAVSAIDDNFQAVEGNIVGGVFGELDVAAAGVVDAVGLADLRGRQRCRFGFVAHDVALNEIFEVVGQLVAVRAEDFHAVVLVGIVGRGDHDAGDGTHGFRQVGDGGRGHGADEIDVHSHGNEAAGDGGFKHVAGNAGVLADEHAITAGAG